jgi:uncharacterized protein (DUF1800 family)
MHPTLQQPLEADAAQPSSNGRPNLAVDPQWAWAEFQPDRERPWNLTLAAHLYRRAGFGADWAQLQQAVSDGPRRSIDQLVHPSADVLADETALDQDEEAAQRTAGIESLRAWWLRRMIQTRYPLREKMTLFWHSHFGVSNARVNSGPLMAGHVQTLRSHALGSYRALLDSVSQDPAVFLAFGADANRKAFPNERFSRQLMERLSLGPGHYGEEDVREAARAFTGWFVLQGRLKYLAHEYDAGVKRVLGQEGPWKTPDIVRIVLAQPAAPRLVARKLFRALVSEVQEPSDELIEPVAKILGEQYDVGQVVETMLRSNLFFSDHALRRRIKSPVEFAVGIVKPFGVLVPTSPLGGMLAQLGQDLYAPPTLQGWVGGPHWINAATMLGRSNLADALLAASGPLGGKLDPQALAQRHGASAPPEQTQFLLRLLLQDDIAPAAHAALLGSLDASAGKGAGDALRQLTYRIVTLPEYQLC